MTQVKRYKRRSHVAVFFITFGKEATNHAKYIGDLTQAHVFVIGSLSVM